MNHLNWIAILDFGSQVTQLIARRIREQNIYCEIIRYDIDPSLLLKRNPKGIILSGGPCSVTDKDAPKCHKNIFDLCESDVWRGCCGGGGGEEKLVEIGRVLGRAACQ